MPSPDISVLAGNSNVFLRDINVHVVQCGFPSNMMHPKETEAIRELEGDRESHIAFQPV